MAPSPHVRLLGAIALGTALALTPTSPALAQTPDELTAARQLFNEGKALEDKRSWGDALEKFKKVAAVKVTPQVRFHIALCEENLGKLVSAMKGFDLAGEEAKAAGSSAVEVATNAPARAEALRGRVAKLHLEATGSVVSSKVFLDDAPLGKSAIGSDTLVDPGAHVVEVRDASGKSTFRKELTLAEKGSEKLELPIDDKEGAPPPPDEPVAPPAASSSRAPAVVVTSLGVVSLVLSGVFFGLRAGTISTVMSHCKGPGMLSQCNPADQGTVDAGKRDGTLSGVFLGTGLAAVATGTILFFVLGPKKSSAPTAKTSLELVPTSNGVQLVGAF